MRAGCHGTPPSSHFAAGSHRANCDPPNQAGEAKTGRPVTHDVLVDISTFGPGDHAGLGLATNRDVRSFGQLDQQIARLDADLGATAVDASGDGAISGLEETVLQLVDAFDLSDASGDTHPPEVLHASGTQRAT